jgi:hypothetical protein
MTIDKAAASRPAVCADLIRVADALSRRVPQPPINRQNLSPHGHARPSPALIGANGFSCGLWLRSLASGFL